MTFLPSIAVRSRDSSTGRRSWASSRVKVREDMGYEAILPRSRSLVVGENPSCVPRRTLMTSSANVAMISCLEPRREFAVRRATCDDLPTTDDRQPTTLLDLQHSIQRYARPVLHVIANFDPVHDVAIHQVLQRPAQVLRGNSEHRGAQAAGVVQSDDFLPFRRELLAHAVDQVNFGADRKRGSCRRLTDHLQQAFGRAYAIRLLAPSPAALRMHNHANAGILRAHVVHMLRQKS